MAYTNRNLKTTEPENKGEDKTNFFYFPIIVQKADEALSQIVSTLLCIKLRSFINSNKMNYTKSRFNK